ncbi:cas scaffolding protein family member 4 [Scleropages formosus]|uniref:cas scaffolding protein family member 4 n=1 Tax=Scleropages formosus TaxID=113540 RepID=UPI0010FA94ED|nr:cas scaffolding protein family member 4 [Scleropages formosus]
MHKWLLIKLLAKALYDNMAECPDELAFRKGDIVTVMDLNVPGSHGWWKCSLHGRQGLAPANRLHLLNLLQVEVQNPYQVPSMCRPSPSQTYEPMDRNYKVPFAHQLASRGLGPSPKSQSSQGLEMPISSYKMDGRGGSKAEHYDVPPQTRRVSHGAGSHKLPGISMTQTASPVQSSELQGRAGRTTDATYSGRLQNNDPSYDIPMSLVTDAEHKPACGGSSTLPSPRKSEWIYDVPVSPEKPAGDQGSYGTMPVKGPARPLYDTPPRAWPALPLYDVPKPSTSPKQSLDKEGPPCVIPQVGVYDILPSSRSLGTPACAVPPFAQEKPRYEGTGSSQRRRVPLPPVQKPRGKTDSVPAPTLAPGGPEQANDVKAERQGSPLARSRSSSPEPTREVTLSPEEASRQLSGLQEAVCQAVPRLMVFVSSRWRCREHLARHVDEIRAAAEDVADATARFLRFASDVRGNARRLTDANLQARLQRQLSILEDSGLILQQAVESLSASGWYLDALAQDVPPPTPDQLDRFVMVARTVPEDIRRLVSILNANSKLLFKQTPKEPDPPGGSSQTDTGSDRQGDQQIGDSGGEDSDYVHLQTKTEFEKQQRMEEESKKSKQMVAKTPLQTLSEHCRLYFGALQRAISAFASSLLEGQPPDSFIDRGKLVIMVGQKLVDTLRREAPGNPAANQDLLCKSTHLCALLKNLALATKDAALQFPNSAALQAALEVARDLAQHAQLYRASMDHSLSSTD